MLYLNSSARLSAGCFLRVFLNDHLEKALGINRSQSSRKCGMDDIAIKHRVSPDLSSRTSRSSCKIFLVPLVANSSFTLRLNLFVKCLSEVPGELSE